MAAATSPATGRLYGIARVCRIWEVPRSSFYAASGRPGRRCSPTQALAADHGPRSRTAYCWQRSAPISPDRLGKERDIARCGPAYA